MIRSIIALSIMLLLASCYGKSPCGWMCEAVPETRRDTMPEFIPFDASEEQMMRTYERNGLNSGDKGVHKRMIITRCSQTYCR